MRTETEIRADIEVKVTEVQIAYATKPVDEARTIEADLSPLYAELSSTLSAGAVQCRCGMPPVGMLKTPSYQMPNGAVVSPVYEVGCIYCPPYLIEQEGKTMRRSISARGATSAEAVQNWNDGNYVVDAQTDRSPHKEGNSFGLKVAKFVTVDEETGEPLDAPRYAGHEAVE